MPDHLDLRLLNQFLTVSRSLTMAAAARELGCSVPAVSQIVQRLERDTGVTLFERTARGLRLTPAGGLLRDRAQALLQAEMDLLHDLAAYRGRLLPRLRVYMADSVARHITPAVVSALRPLVGDLDLRSGHSSTYVQDFVAGRVDMLICSEPIEEVPHLDRFRLCTEELVAAVPVAGGKLGLAAQARELPFIRPATGSRMERSVQDYLAREGLSPRQSIECDSIAPTLELVEAGLGWTISTPLYLASAKPDPGRIAYQGLAPPRPVRALFLLASAGRWLDVPATLAGSSRAAMQDAARTWPRLLQEAVDFT